MLKRIPIGPPERNRIVHSITGLVYGSSFNGLRIQVTPSWLNEDLCDRSARVLAVVESWDHHCKMPTGYHPDAVVCWNERLLAAWNEHQGARTSHIGYPHKLGYATTAEPSSASSEPHFLYAFTLSSHSPDFDEEVALVHRVAAIAAECGVKLDLKFKPAELQEVQQRVKGELLLDGWGGKGNGSGDAYRLTRDYNDERIDELGRATAVISFGTTFALDVAAANTPMAQFDLSQLDDGFQTLRALAANEHLKDLLYPTGLPAFRPKNLAGLDSQLRDMFTNPNERPADFTKATREWLLPDASTASAIQDLGDLIVQMVEEIDERPQVGSQEPVPAKLTH
ncbi:MAG: hypothetical protein HKN13_10180 [Rhodothermales bacterium]|nr:hypothetical protein [Rhodothermales bacterium]